MVETKHSAGLMETLLGLLILVGLAGIGYWVYQQQFHWNPALKPADSLTTPPPAPAAASPVRIADVFPQELPAGLKIAAPAEQFEPDTLADKIDGKAELYVASGFKHLYSQRFCSSSNSAAWFEAFAYDMDNARQAFSVFSQQRREESTNLDITAFAYKTDNALFFTHGNYYVEIISGDTSAELMEPMDRFARLLVAKPTTPQAAPAELALFPQENLVVDTRRLYVSDGFGFPQFSDLFAAEYNIAETTVTGFITTRSTPEDATTLVKSYGDFLIANGGMEENVSTNIAGARLFNVFGTYEVILNSGPRVGGVHQADSKDAAEQLARMLRERLDKEGP